MKIAIISSVMLVGDAGSGTTHQRKVEIPATDGLVKPFYLRQFGNGWKAALEITVDAGSSLDRIEVEGGIKQLKLKQIAQEQPSDSRDGAFVPHRLVVKRRWWRSKGTVLITTVDGRGNSSITGVDLQFYRFRGVRVTLLPSSKNVVEPLFYRRRWASSSEEKSTPWQPRSKTAASSAAS